MSNYNVYNTPVNTIVQLAYNVTDASKNAINGAFTGVSTMNIGRATLRDIFDISANTVNYRYVGFDIGNYCIPTQYVSYTSTGHTTATIPTWCKKIRVICVGGGGGGGGGGGANFSWWSGSGGAGGGSSGYNISDYTTFSGTINSDITIGNGGNLGGTGNGGDAANSGGEYNCREIGHEYNH